MFDFPQNRSLACVTIGRANLDLYPPAGQRLAEARSYRAFVGGSPANIAAGLVKRGLTAGLITKVADDGIGHFVKNYLADFGVDTSQIFLAKDFASRTSLVLAECCRNAQTVFYRQQPSDLLLQAKDIDYNYIASAQVLIVSGAAICQQPCRSAVQAAINAAKQAGTLVAMDIDYRPHGWDSQERAAELLQQFAAQCDLLLGTEEEFCLAANIQPPARQEGAEGDSAFEGVFPKLFPKSQLSVVKRGKAGATAYLPNGQQVAAPPLPAALKKPWGAGDAFAASLLASLLLGKNIAASMEDAAAAASLNISGTSCTEAMPNSAEIEDFLRRCRSGQLPPEWSEIDIAK